MLAKAQEKRRLASNALLEMNTAVESQKVALKVAGEVQAEAYRLAALESLRQESSGSISGDSSVGESVGITDKVSQGIRDRRAAIMPPPNPASVPLAMNPPLRSAAINPPPRSAKPPDIQN